MLQRLPDAFKSFQSHGVKYRGPCDMGLLGRFHQSAGWTDTDKHGRTRTELSGDMAFRKILLSTSSYTEQEFP
jgi:hypothetical protein